MNSITNYFEIKCKNCGSDYIEIELHQEDYSDYESVSEVHITCRNCYNTYVFGGEK